MQINREEHPSVRFVRGSDGAIHCGSQMGGTWCSEDADPDDDEYIELEGIVNDDEVTAEDMCQACLDDAVEEELITL